MLSLPRASLRAPALQRGFARGFSSSVPGFCKSFVIGRQNHEADPLVQVLLHESPRLRDFSALLPEASPFGALLREPELVSDGLGEELSNAGVTVHNIESVLTGGARTPQGLDKLRRLAHASLTYDLHAVTSKSDLTKRQQLFMSDGHKWEIICGMTIDKLVEVILTRPTVVVHKPDINSVFYMERVISRPLTELLTVRDSFITTRAGAVLCRTDFLNREAEKAVVSHVLEELGCNILGQLPAPCSMQGSDFFPAGPDLCFIGAGSRTTREAADTLMRKGWLGTRRVAVVSDVFYRRAPHLCLSDVFTILDEKTVAMPSSVLKGSVGMERIVDEYERDAEGVYRMIGRDIPFVEFIQREGFDILPFPPGAMCSAAVNVGNGKILTNKNRVAEQLRSKGKEVILLDRIYNEKEGQEVMAANSSLRARCQALARAYDPKVAPKKCRSIPSSEFRLFNPKDEISQTTRHALMVSPTSFFLNSEAAEDNYFMSPIASMTKTEVQERVLAEYHTLHTALKRAGVDIVLYSHDSVHGTPDALFVNNWFSTHPAGEVDNRRTLVLYPMKVPTRRRERRPDIINAISKMYNNVVTLSDFEQHAGVLEGTGSIVMDRINRIAYVSLSERATPEIVDVWGMETKYKIVPFHSVDLQGRTVYHTNVVMGLGSSCAVVCLEAVSNAEERYRLEKSLSEYHTVIPITLEQVHKFCGNVIELKGHDDKRIMAMSTQAYKAFNDGQRAAILRHVDEIVHADISTIETIGGGGVRCCIGELF